MASEEVAAGAGFKKNVGGVSEEEVREGEGRRGNVCGEEGGGGRNAHQERNEGETLANF